MHRSDRERALEPVTRSRCKAVFVIGSIPIFQDDILRGEIARVGTQPGIDLLWLDRHDAAVMPCGGDFGRWLVGDGRKRIQVRLIRRSPL